MLSKQPFTLILLEDNTNEAFAEGLAKDKPTLRRYLATELVPKLLEHKVRGIVLDFSLSRHTSEAMETELLTMLSQAHATDPPTPVVAVASDAPLIGECADTQPKTGCFDALLPAELVEPGDVAAEDGGWVKLEQMNTCVGGRSTLARALATWLSEAPGREDDGKRAPLSAPVRSGCIQQSFPMKWGMLDMLPPSLASQQALSDAEAARLENHVVLIGMGHPAFGDQLPVWLPDGSRRTVAGPLVLSVALESLLQGEKKP